MITRNKQGALTNEEKTIVKALLNKKMRNQDIQALINIERSATINSARITEVKQDTTIVAADDDKVDFFKIHKRSYDPNTGLNLFDHERLIRSREAIILAVQVFNSPALLFKSGVFSMLANVAWTYLLHEYYERKNIKITEDNGRSLALSKMLTRQDCPLSKGIKENLRALKIIRDEVEHKCLGRADTKWFGLFQACCLNFNNVICDLFGDRLTLAHDLSFAIQFSKLNFEQLSTLNRYEIPAHINAIDARLSEGMTDAEIDDLEYQFRVIYTLDSVTKSNTDFQFVKPDSAEGKNPHNVLVKHQIADKLYPYKPNDVVSQVKQRTGKTFRMHEHTKAWKTHKVRPITGVAQPENTNREYCLYHAAHKDYTYSNKWVELLIAELEK